MDIILLVIFLIFLFAFGIIFNIYLNGEEEWVDTQIKQIEQMKKDLQK